MAIWESFFQKRVVLVPCHWFHPQLQNEAKHPQMTFTSPKQWLLGRCAQREISWSHISPSVILWALTLVRAGGRLAEEYEKEHYVLRSCLSATACQGLLEPEASLLSHIWYLIKWGNGRSWTRDRSPDASATLGWRVAIPVLMVRISFFFPR